MNFETIKELYEAVKAGKIKESELTIVLSDDCADFYLPNVLLEEGVEAVNEIKVCETNKYNEIEALYKLLFPKAKVEW